MQAKFSYTFITMQQVSIFS